MTNGFTTTFHHGKLIVPKIVNRCRISNELRPNSPVESYEFIGNSCATLTIRVVRSFTQRVVSVELERPAEPPVKAKKELTLIKLSTRLVAIDFTSASDRVEVHSALGRNRARNGALTSRARIT